MCAACKWVDEVIWEDTELVITKEFIEKQYVLATMLMLAVWVLILDSQIDIVCHGDDFDEAKMKLYYSVPLEMGIFRALPYAILQHQCEARRTH